MKILIPYTITDRWLDMNGMQEWTHTEYAIENIPDKEYEKILDYVVKNWNTLTLQAQFKTGMNITDIVREKFNYSYAVIQDVVKYAQFLVNYEPLRK